MTEATDNKVREDVWGNKLPCELYMDGYLQSNTHEMRELVKNNWDVIGFIVGYEGDGKTALAMQLALSLNAGFNLDQIVFNIEQFDEAVENSPPKSVIIWDEADSLGGRWWDDMMIALKKKFKRIRKKNLFIILVTPTVFDLDKYFVIHRTRFLIHVYAEGLKRGYFRFFNREGKKKLYLYGKKNYDLNAANASFYGRFTNYPKNFPIDLEVYEAKKDEATAAILATDNQNKAQRVAQYRKECVERYYSHMISKHDIKPTQQDAAYVFDVDRTLISKDLKAIEEGATTT